MNNSKQGKSDTMENTPESLLPELEMYGIESDERGVCEDTAENRKILRRHGLQWQVIYNSDGTLSPNIRAISPAMTAASNVAVLSARKGLLVDDRDPESDYKTGVDLILLPDSELENVPAWVVSGTHYFNRVLRKREETGKMLEPELAGPPARCLYMKTNGHRCLLWQNGRNSMGMCRQHLQASRKNADTPGMLVERARVRVKQASIAAIDQLETLMETAESEPVRLQAARDILDRAGIRGGVEVEQKVTVEMRPAEDVLAERLKVLQERAHVQQQLTAMASEPSEPEPEIIDADVIESTEDPWS